MIWKIQPAPRSVNEAEYSESLSLNAAQQFCPFVVFEPSELPTGYRLCAISFRSEQPPKFEAASSDADQIPVSSNPPKAGHSTTIRVMAKRQDKRISIKQFFYDWLPPAYDHPCLWRSTIKPIAASVLGAIGWIGLNYRGQHAASITLHRTTIEITDIDNSVRDEDLMNIMLGMRPVDRIASSAITTTPFGSLCYGSRYSASVPQVPLGYWTYIMKAGTTRRIEVIDQEQDVDVRYCLLKPIENIAELHFGDHAAPMLTRISYDLNSKAMAEEFVCECVGNLNASFRIICINNERDRKSSDDDYYLAPDSQHCTRERVRVFEHDVDLAYLDESYGQHEFVFAQEHLIYIFILKPQTFTNLDYGLRLFEALRKQWVNGYEIGLKK